jgi:hypothetical protein
MKLTDLFAERYDTYFAAAHHGDPVWLFVHVPKTAGSSLNGELVPILSPSHQIYIDYDKLDPGEISQSYEALFNRSVENFISMAQQKHFRYCTGHINAAQVARIVAAVPDVRPVTLLRDPVARFVSDYRYQRSPMHPGNEQFRARFPRIEDYLKVKGEWNKTATSLLPAGLRAGGDAEACVDWLLAHYAFIGIQEDYALSLHVLSWFAGKPRRPSHRKRINAPTPDNDVPMTEELMDDIRAANALDIAIYDAIAPRFAALRESLTGYLERVAPVGATV